ncbi:hypothetical protein WSM22_09960 [Cytophagales bacterium WSM2-2]|nr:hypothetical protein WSM22_09960 [Cytophagales bacterium WSM2-2]
MLRPAFLYLFLAVAAAEILFKILNIPEVNLFIKPLIVPTLTAFYFQNSESRNRLFILAMVFCWAGDFFLLFDSISQLYFMGGLGSFLIAHIILYFLYGSLKSGNGPGLNGPQRARLSFPVILAGSGLITILYPTLGGLKVPVIIYALALMLMVLQSIYRYGFTSSQSFWNICIGALLFMLSDSVLAINKFYQPVVFGGVIIISTYMAAMYFIVQGVLAHRKQV